MAVGDYSIQPECCRRGGFTLVELLVVIAVITLLAVALLPSMSSLGKSSGRKAAANLLANAVEEARALAMKDGQPAYVVFATFSAASQLTLDKYNYRSFSIWEDDAAATPTAQKQITEWKTLPIGIALRAKSGAPESLTNLPAPSALTPAPTFIFAPDSAATPAFRVIKFNSNGEVEAPSTNVILAVFEGYISSSGEVITGAKDSFNPPNPLATEAIGIARLTGRAYPTATSVPAS